MAAAASVYFPRHLHGGLLKLVAATSVDTQDVASKIPAKPSVSKVVGNGFSIVIATWKVRGGFRRLSERQAKMIQRLSAEDFHAWRQHDCGELAILIDELVQDEHGLMQKVSAAPGPVQSFWGRDVLDGINRQVCELQAYCTRLDAMSVVEMDRLGDEDFHEFMNLLSEREGLDFSLDRDQQKV